MMNLRSTIHFAFVFYTLLLLARVLSSWLPPHIQRHRLLLFVAFYTDPYLNLFRRFLPPIGGVLDLSPLLAFFGLRILETFIFWVLSSFG